MAKNENTVQVSIASIGITLTSDGKPRLTFRLDTLDGRPSADYAAHHFALYPSIEQLRALAELADRIADKATWDRPKPEPTPLIDMKQFATEAAMAQFKPEVG